MSLRIRVEQARQAGSDAIGEIKHKATDAFDDAKSTVGGVGQMVSGTLEAAATSVGAVAGMVGNEVVDVLPTLPAIPAVPLQPVVAKRGEGMFKINMLQEGRRRDDPMYDPKGMHMSKSQERLLLRTFFYILAFIAIAFLILAFVFQLGIGQASQAAIWALSATFLGGALALNTRVPRKEPSRCAGIAGIIITLCTFAAFIIFCMGTANGDLDKLGMGLGVFVTCVGTIAAGMWTYNLWFPSKRAHQIYDEDVKALGAFNENGALPTEQGTLAAVERGTPAHIRRFHLVCNVLTVILWYLFAILLIFFTFDIRGLVSDTALYAPPGDGRVPLTNVTIPQPPPPYEANTTTPTLLPTISPSPPGTGMPTVVGDTYSPSVSPSSRPSEVPTTPEPTRRPSAGPSSSSPSATPSTSQPSVHPSVSRPSSSPSAVPTTTIPSQEPSRTPSTIPSSIPSLRPSQTPSTSSPSVSPSTSSPTDSPSVTITIPPTMLPTSQQPSQQPSTAPSKSPFSSKPSIGPTSSKPSIVPTSSTPSIVPTSTKPSHSPSKIPSRAPSTKSPTTSSPTSAAPTMAPSDPFVPVPDPPVNPPLPPGTIIIGGTMHFQCVGDPAARPVVLLEHDVGTTLDIWAWVQERVATVTYVCAYSRRGYGYSSPGNKPRTPDLAVVELQAALLELNITSPIVHVGHGYAAFQLRRYYHAYKDNVAALVFVDAYSTQCFKKPKCDAKEKKGDDNGFASLESLIPIGIIRALAYSGASYPGPSGECVPLLPMEWGGSKKFKAKDRMLAALLTPALWAAALTEDVDSPAACAIAAQSPGNSHSNRIQVPLVSIVASDGIFATDKNCGFEIKNGGGGKAGKGTKSRDAQSYSVEIEDANHWTILCDAAKGYEVGDEIIKVVNLVRRDSKTYIAITNAGKKTWAQAKSYCEARGQRLASFPAENNALDIKDLGLNSANDNFWIGGSDLQVPGTFKWEDGALISAGFQEYASHEPSGIAGRNCLEMSRSNHKWTTRTCTDTNYFVCEQNDF